MDIFDLYTDYLICQNKYATATGLSDLLNGDVSHDKITRFLSSGDFGSKELWSYVISYCKLEFLKIKTNLNHFAIKYKLIIRANQIAMQELQKMNS